MARGRVFLLRRGPVFSGRDAMLKALMNFPYAGRTIRAGQLFEAVSAEDAHLLVLGDRATQCDVTASDQVTEVERDRYMSKQARRYKRRDMRAQR